MYQAQQGPGHWDRCTPVRYRINTANATQSALSDFSEALNRVAFRSGLTFVQVGTTDIVPWTTDDWFNAMPTDTDMVVAWSNAATVSGLAGNVVGLGGGVARVPSGREPQIFRGGLVLDYEAPLTPGFVVQPGQGAHGQLVMHELGHVLGLGHVSDTYQVMYPSLNSIAQGRFQAGDVAGFNQLASYPCF